MTLQKKQFLKKDELTEKMHSELYVTKETEIKHSCFAFLAQMTKGRSMKDALRYSGVTKADLEKHLKEFNELTGGNARL